MSDVVLVHGAFAGGFCWRRTAELLRAHGHRVWTPTLTGLGERRHLLTPEVDLNTHIRDIEAVLYYEDIRDAVLVAHSYAGMVVAGLGDEAADRIAHVVLLDAALPEDGEAIRDVYASVPDDQLPAEVRRLHHQSRPDPGQLVMPVPPEERQEPRLSPQPMSTHWSPVRLGRCFDAGRKRTYIECTGWGSMNRVSAERARAAGWTVWQMPTPHTPMVTHPELLVEQIERAIGA